MTYVVFFVNLVLSWKVITIFGQKELTFRLLKRKKRILILKHLPIWKSMVNFFFLKCDNKSYMLSNLKHPKKDANFPRNDILHAFSRYKPQTHAMIVISTRFMYKEENLQLIWYTIYVCIHQATIDRMRMLTHIYLPLKTLSPANNCVRELASFIRRINGSIFNLFYFYRNFVKIYSDKDNGS